MSLNLGQRLIARWKGEDLVARPGVSPAELDAFEEHNRVRLPGDLRDYFSVVNGTGRFTEMDQTYHCWWSLEEMIAVSMEWPDDDFLEDADTTYLFADHSISCPAYAIRLGDSERRGEVLAILSDNRSYDSYTIAASFTELMERYLRGEFLH
jgi:hypothetical protein